MGWTDVPEGIDDPQKPEFEMKGYIDKCPVDPDTTEFMVEVHPVNWWKLCFRNTVWLYIGKKKRWYKLGMFGSYALACGFAQQVAQDLYEGTQDEQISTEHSDLP